MLEGELEAGIALGGVVVEGAGGDVGSGGVGDVRGAVGGAGVEDVDVVRPCYGGERGGEVLRFVFGEDEDGEWAAQSAGSDGIPLKLRIGLWPIAAEGEDGVEAAEGEGVGEGEVFGWGERVQGCS